MSTATPEQAVQSFFDSFNRGDLASVIALYEPNATLIPQPGTKAEGHAAIREALAAFLGMKPTLTPQKRSLVTCGDLSLSLLKWTLEGTGPDGKPVHMEGTTSDVLRKQADGRWLFVIDNPWGAGIVS